MNRRLAKKREKAAVKTLIEKYGYSKSDFFPASYDYWRDNYARGTPIFGCMSGYYEPEWDEKLPSEVLGEIEWVNSVDWDEVARKEQEEWEAMQKERQSKKAI